MTVIIREIREDELCDLIAQKVIDKIKEIPQKVEKKESYLTAREVAARLRISLPTLSKYCKSGLIPSYRISRSLRFRASEIDQIINQGLRFKTKIKP